MYRTSSLFLGSSTLLFLAACGGGTARVNCPVEPTPVERFSLCLANGFHQSTEAFGEAGSFIVKITADTGTGTLMQIHVKKDPLQDTIISSIEFSERAIAITRERAPNYKVVSTDPIMVGNRETLLHIFDASDTAESEPVRYYQFVTTNESIAYGFTAILSPNVDEDTREVLLGILKSVTFAQ